MINILENYFRDKFTGLQIHLPCENITYVVEHRFNQQQSFVEFMQATALLGLFLRNGTMDWNVFCRSTIYLITCFWQIIYLADMIKSFDINVSYLISNCSSKKVLKNQSKICIQLMKGQYLNSGLIFWRMI